MSKRPLHVLTLVSAIVCAGSLGLAVRSVFRVDQVWIPIGQNRSFAVTAIDGQLLLSSPRPFLARFYYGSSTAEARPSLASLWSNVTGIRWLGIGWGTWYEFSYLILPLWLVPLLTAILPVRWWRARRRGGARGFEVASSHA